MTGGYVLSVDDAKQVLRVSNRYNDRLIQNMVASAQEYLFIATGHRWELDETMNPLAEEYVRLKIYMDYYNDYTDINHLRLTALCKQLQVVARGLEENMDEAE